MYWKDWERAAQEVDEYLFVKEDTNNAGRYQLFRKHPGFRGEFHIINIDPLLSPSGLQRYLRSIDNSQLDFKTEFYNDWELSEKTRKAVTKDKRTALWSEIAHYIRKHY